MFDLRNLLIEHRHEVVPFAMKDGRNESTGWDRWFVSSVRSDASAMSWQGLRTVGRYMYSFEAKHKFGALLRESLPDLVHIQNIYHQISPSILPVARRRGIPVVMTAHDYKLIAPNYSLFHDGQVCRHTRPDHYWEAVKHRCVRGSMVASAVCAAEMSLHRLLGLWRDNIDVVIAPSAFVAATLKDYGIDHKKIVQIPHFINVSSWQPSYEGDYALYVGRLSSEKGVETLIRAAAMVGDLPIRVVGVGSDGERLRHLANELKLRNVTFVGYQVGEQLRREYTNARFVVIPSLCHETFGLTALEAYAAGKPVIASQMGGLSEIVESGKTGQLVQSGDVIGLAEAMAKLWADPKSSERMGRSARQVAERNYSPEQHYQNIMGVYRRVLSQKI